MRRRCRYRQDLSDALASRNAPDRTGPSGRRSLPDLPLNIPFTVVDAERFFRCRNGFADTQELTVVRLGRWRRTIAEYRHAESGKTAAYLGAHLVGRSCQYSIRKCRLYYRPYLHAETHALERVKPAGVLAVDVGY